jgi:hypothetical protein
MDFVQLSSSSPVEIFDSVKFSTLPKKEVPEKRISNLFASEIECSLYYKRKNFRLFVAKQSKKLGRNFAAIFDRIKCQHKYCKKM